MGFNTYIYIYTYISTLLTTTHNGVYGSKKHLATFVHVKVLLSRNLVKVYPHVCYTVSFHNFMFVFAA